MTCPHIISSGITQYCGLAEQAVRERDEEIARLVATLQAIAIDASSLSDVLNNTGIELWEVDDAISAIAEIARLALPRTGEKE